MPNTEIIAVMNQPGWSGTYNDAASKVLASLETDLASVLEARFRREMCDTRRYAHEEPYALAIEEAQLREKIEEMKKELRQ